MRKSIQELLQKYGLTNADRLDRIEAAALVESFVSPNWKDLASFLHMDKDQKLALVNSL